MSLDIKICGLKTEAALAAALAGAASHVGFIFFPKSPRNVDPVEAGRLRQAARGKAVAVAVTVDADDATLDRIVAAMHPDMLQLHGHESPDRVAAVKTRFGLPVMKALSIRTAADLGAVASYRGVADRLMFDAKPPAGSELPGGNGVSFDWRLLAGLDADVDYMLSGGLNAANIGEALRLANPSGIDISSGVESAPGVKEPALIEAFFRAVRAAAGNRAA
jgi:phosphoribosylanthranilate isomerase